MQGTAVCPAIDAGLFHALTVETNGASPLQRRRRSPLWAIAALACLIGLAAPAAHALPITNTITTGTAQILVFVGSNQIGSTFSNLINGSLVIDETAQSLDALDITIGPNVPLTLSSAYGGYDNIVIETTNLSDGTGYSSSLLSSSGSSFQVSAGPIDVAASWAASDSSLVNPPVSGVPISFTIPSITSVVNGSVTMNGLTLFVLPGAQFGEAEDLTVLANLSMDFVPVPEPNTAVLIGLSLAALSGVRRRP